MKSRFLTATGAAAVMLLSQAAQANTIVSTIIGAYDSACAAATCGNVSGISHFASNGGNYNDNPNLYIYNQTGNSFTSVQLTLTGYNGINNGVTETVSLPNIGAHTLYKLIWGADINGVTSSINNPTPTSIVAGSLFTYDYDDEYGNVIGSGGTGKDSGHPDSAGNFCGQTGSGASNGICAFVGAFDVSFSALDNGNPISSNFSPDNTQDGGNIAGTFVGFEGIDPDGLSETKYDNHSGAFPGTLADIFTGTGQGQNVPEPGTLVLLSAGLGALGMARRRRKSR